MIDDEFLQILCCPSCKSDLTLRAEMLVCKSCGKEYDIIDGIPILLSSLTEDVGLSLSKWNAEYENIQQKTN